MTDCLLVIDANLSDRMASALKKRGRDAVAVKEFGIENDKDPPLLERLAREYDNRREWVLVTADDNMPQEHDELLKRLRVTVATIDMENCPLGPQEEEWKWETVQRWAHRMATQNAQTFRRYNPKISRAWTPPRPRKHKGMPRRKRKP